MSNPAWVLLARLVRPQGRKGEIIAEIFTDFPERFATRQRVFLAAAEGSPARTTLPPRQVEIERYWLHQGRIVFKFKGIDSINDVDLLRGLEVVIPGEERAPLEDDAVYIGDLIGCQVIDTAQDADASVGEILDVERGTGGAPDLLIVRRPLERSSISEEVEPPEQPGTQRGTPQARRGKRARKPAELLIPFEKKYLVSVDIAAKTVTMQLPPGLLELNANHAPEPGSPGHASEDEEAESEA